MMIITNYKVNHFDVRPHHLLVGNVLHFLWTEALSITSAAYIYKSIGMSNNTLRIFTGVGVIGKYVSTFPHMSIVRLTAWTTALGWPWFLS